MKKSRYHVSHGVSVGVALIITGVFIDRVPGEVARPPRAQDVERSAEERAAKVRELTQRLIDAATEGKHEKALEAALEALGHAEKLPAEFQEQRASLLNMTHYNVACMYSLTGRKDAAFEHLDQAIAAGGFRRDFAEQIDADKDFDNIRKDPRFAKTVERAGAESDKRSSETARRLGMLPARTRDDGAPKVGDAAPAFKLKSFKGDDRTDLAGFRGKRPVLLFFGSYT